MPRLRIALAQVDLTVGDVAGNAAVIREWTARAVAAGADLVAFPEMALTGYPPEDLVYRDALVAAAEDELAKLAVDSGETVVVLGTLAEAAGRRNTAAVLWTGAERARYFKHHLPNYGVFDERRYFTPGREGLVLQMGGADVAVTICEDLWQDGGTVAASGEAGASLVVVINGSPYEREKAWVRRELVARRAAETGAVFAYVNLVGGQDELVFDGDSMIVAPDGRVLAHAPRFVETLLVHDIDLPANPGFPTELPVRRIALGASLVSAGKTQVSGGVATDLDPIGEVYAAVVTGTRDYVLKNGFRSVVLGLSGGIDSALVATVAVDALGADNVHTVALPSEYSSPHSLSDAADLAERQGTHHQVVPIEPAVAAVHVLLEHSGGLHGLAAENLQARVRGVLLMALSNEHGHLVLTTGNKSELATGFSTLYGDAAGGFAVIKDVPKTLVWALARWRNAQADALGEREPIPQNCITKPPSAELAPDQLDADRLPPYDVLDPILEAYVEDDASRDTLLGAGYDPAIVDRVIRLVDAAEFKRRQYPPGPKITARAFGRDRRLPITNHFREGSTSG